MGDVGFVQRGTSGVIAISWLFLSACHHSDAPEAEDAGASSDASIDADSFDAPVDRETIAQACDEGHASTADWLPWPLTRRIALVEDPSGALVASGEYTLSGEPAPIDAFRAR
ncbi:MAG: hypothetical protein ACI9KE_001314 [Polyangiales bacterium]